MTTQQQATQPADKDALHKEMNSLAWEIYIRDRESTPDFAYNRALGWIRAKERLGLSMPQKAEVMS